MPDLSVLIPARSEEWLGHTVQDVLAHSSERTEIIVVLDGEWPKEPLPQHPRVTVLYHPQPVGQRAATNEAARVSTAKYVCKMDAHVSVADGWDVALMDAAEMLPRETIQVPAQRNLHCFDWVCACGWRKYQGPTPPACPTCGGIPTKEIVWKPRRGTSTTSWVFDHTLHFQYDRQSKSRPDAKAPLRETMSCIGACWFLDREWFLNDLGGLDEAHGSYGQMGTELGCKAWLSGGQMLCNTTTSFSHLFRTQGGDFGFPFPISGRDIDIARKYSRDLWLGNKWAGQIRPLSWLVEKFSPHGWTAEQRAALPKTLAIDEVRTKGLTAGILYYSDAKPDRSFLKAVARRLALSATSLPIVQVTLGKPLAGLGKAIALQAERGPLTMAKQILAGLEALDTDVVFFTEHDVLYPADYFSFRPPTADAYYYAANTYKVCADTGRALTYQMEQLSGLCADRQLLLGHFRRRVAHIEQHGFTRRLGFEPGKPIRHGGLDDIPRKTWDNPTPIVDIRHSQNLTPSRWRKDQFRSQRYTEGWTEADGVPGWGQTAGRFDAFLQETTRGV